MDGRTPTVLIVVTGDDAPGVTSALFGALGAAAVEVLDVEQVVIRGRLLLGVLVTDDGARSWRPAVEEAMGRLGLHVDIRSTAGDAHETATTSGAHARSHVTVLGLPLTAAAFAAVADEIRSGGGSIERILRVARYPVTAIELQVRDADPAVLRRSLAETAVRTGIDVAVQAGGLHRRAKRLVVMDVDSTLVQGEVVEMLAAHAGCEAEVARITDRAMQGELDFEESLRERVALLEGLPAQALDEVHAALELMPGARTLVRTLRRLGFRTAIVSGGFSQITDRLASDLGIDHARANRLEIVDGRLTGRIDGPVVDRAAKAAALREFAAIEGVPVDRTVAIGDGANDLDMIEAAGLGIAFNAKPVLRQAADASVSVPFLDAILYLLGVPREEIEQADADDGVVTRSPVVR